MKLPKDAYGIHQSDLIIRSALILAFEDLRANPYLLDYAFASLLRDNETKNEYGQREIDAAKKWFLSTKIPIFMSTIINDVTMPCISISLVDSNEEAVTLADVHYNPRQDSERVWPALCPAFTPTSYTASTGRMIVPESVGIIIAPGQLVVDKAGVAHEILEVEEDFQFLIKANTVADFRNSVIKGQRPSEVVHLESVRMKETYALGCHVQGEQTHLTYLHSLLVFCLYRYKARYLEERGFERSVVASSDFRRNDSFDNELTFSRHINLTGYVQQTWPSIFSPKVTAVVVQPEFSDVDLDIDSLAFSPFTKK